MKRIITIFLVFTMLFSATTFSVCAEEVGIGNKTVDVQAKYNTGNRVATYSVDITWGAMQFEYDANGDEEWDPSEHEWVSSSSQWKVKDDSNTVTVSNNSSTAVDAAFAFSGKKGFESMKGTFSSQSDVFSNDVISMPIANKGEQAKAHTVTFMPTGSLPSNVTEYTSVGTITIVLKESKG